MPSAIAGPTELIEPPRAGTLLTVSNSRAVLKLHSSLPSAVETAWTTPLVLLRRPGLHPFQPGRASSERKAGFAVHCFGIERASPALSDPSRRPLIDSATRRFSSSVRLSPMTTFIEPLVSEA